MDARTFQTEALKIEKLLYHISYAMLRNESDCEDAVQEALLRASLGYGEGSWGVGSGVADYVFSHEDAYPEQVYLAPQTGEDSADMAWAIPLPMRK